MKMAKRLQEYVKYTIKELESYTKQEGSCVRKINSGLHISLGPYCLADFKHALSAHIMRRKVGYFDARLEGIVLDIKNIKVLGMAAALRSDDPSMHVDVNADCYVFRPVAGAILSGVVKHVGNHHIGVIIYRVFNVSIRFAAKINKDEFKMDDTLRFRIKNFNLQHVFPYIEGDLVTESGVKIVDKFIKVEPESANANLDSGIEEHENHELDELVTLIKQENVSEDEGKTLKANKKKDKSAVIKRKPKTSANEVSFNEPLPVKKEISPEKKKRKSANSEELNVSQTEKVSGKNKKAKITNELLVATQIKKEDEKDKRKTIDSEQSNGFQTDKISGKSKKHKATNEILNATQIKTEAEEEVTATPAKRRRSKANSIGGEN
ncbi:DNA-directed RNA polymerase I subunit RPA43 [Anastrepha ludens]|uniref:DNA-directed RNA polymerase I subunit RPA43 n=1 Tax=Anastrepha ludens TaxID=28586 RepID=UPI0023AFBA7B|nr:DNA-directed RNA polymerase I subunit RPA43 [Anastrepha ludens]